MPICPLCDTAYLASEQHTCEPRSGAMSELGMTAVGLIAGAVVGSLLATVLYGLLTGSNLSGIVGFGFWGTRRRRRRSRYRRTRRETKKEGGERSDERVVVYSVRVALPL